MPEAVERNQLSSNSKAVCSGESEFLPKSLRERNYTAFFDAARRLAHRALAAAAILAFVLADIFRLVRRACPTVSRSGMPKRPVSSRSRDSIFSRIITARLSL